MEMPSSQIDPNAVIRALLRANRDLTQANHSLMEAVEAVLPKPEAAVGFVPTDFQREILAALKGKGLRTDALAAKCGNQRRKLFADPGGIPELQEEGLVGHHPRVGYYSLKFPPPDLEESASK